MAIKAKIPSGQKNVRTSAMYQWDYGQTLEIEAENLPSLIEVHFACHGMTEAVVHTCSAVNGVATVAIPDRCLEQSTEITAWVYEIEGDAGRTIYSISIPITARTRPARSESIPQSVQDTYTQLITEVNELLEALQSGTVNVGYAARAGSADKATTADSATTATSANTAGSATKAVNDGDDNKISDTYLKIPDDYAICSAGTALGVGFYVFRILVIGESSAENQVAVADIGGTVIAQNVYSSTFAYNDALYRLQFGSASNTGASFVGVQSCDASGASIANCTVYYKKLMN